MAAFVPFAIGAAGALLGAAQGIQQENQYAKAANRQRAEALNQLEAQLAENAQQYFSRTRTKAEHDAAVARAEQLWQQVMSVFAPGGRWDDWGRQGYEERKAGGSNDWETKYVLAIKNDVPVGGAAAPVLSALGKAGSVMGMNWWQFSLAVAALGVIAYKVVR